MSDEPLTSFRLIEEAFAPLAGRRVLDIGCGPGLLARALVRRGADVVGIDLSPDAVSSARTGVPQARFEVADGAALPFDDESFEGAVFLNSLHHIPADAMGLALLEAARVVGRGRPVVVIEPLPEGSFFETFRPIEDETLVRGRAREALDDAMRAGTFACARDARYGRQEEFDHVDAFIARATVGDRSRDEVVRRRRPEIEAAFAAAAARGEGGRYRLDQPMRGLVLQVV